MPTGVQSDTIHAEGARFARYLLGCRPSDEVLERYERAVRSGATPLARRDQALLRFAQLRPRALGLLDAGLAVTNPHAELRRRLYLMFAILEATPEYHHRFLPTDRAWSYPLVVAYAGVRGTVKATLGVVLVRLVTR